MTDKLPPNLLALFAPRPALRYLPFSDHAPEDRKTSTITGVAQYLDKLREPDDYQPTESWLQRRDRLKLEKKEKQEHHLTEGVKQYDPAKDPHIKGDPFRTLFVSRLSYDTKEADLEREFGRFGPIERIRLVTNTHDESKNNTKKKHRGYAFIVYERERDMKAAYKETDGIRIKDRRVLVDVERGRTVKGWRPRRFGGGLGGRGYTRAGPIRPLGPAGFSAPSGPGGFRGGGGGGGGFRGGGFGGRGGGRGGFGGPPPGRGMDHRGGGGGRPMNGFGQPPPNAPSGPSGGRSAGGFGGGYGGSRPYGNGDTNMGGTGGPAAPNGPRFDDARSGGGPGGGYRGGSRGAGGYPDQQQQPTQGDSRIGAGSGSNREPVRPRGENRDRDRGDRDARDGRDGGYRDRDRDRDRDRGGDRYRDERGGGGGGAGGKYNDGRDGGRDGGNSRKRHYDDVGEHGQGSGYQDPRQRRRY
ncbi:MAG: Glycerol kinase [Watsoniomyces obsoletus]|nr:MAG: Glycerol kinase [Watsoniomyces obsoletus]